MSDFKTWECNICGWIYDESKGWPDDGIAPGTRWEDIPDAWLCPDCGVGKADFDMVEASVVGATPEIHQPITPTPVAQDHNQQPLQIWECLVCGWTYDEAKGWPEDGIAPGTRWADIDEDWLCPECGVGKQDFEMVAVSRAEPVPTAPPPRPQLDHSRAPLVIVGTGLAGYNLAREFRQRDQTTPLVMITRDDGRYYSKPLISTGYHRKKTAEQMASASAEAMAAELHAELRIFTRVESVDTQNRTLCTDSGTLEYGKLVLATGARCIEAPLQGNGLSRVYSVNDLLDYTKFRTAMVGKKKVLIIGAGLIGAEYTNDLIQAGFELDVVDPLDTVLGTLLPKTASASVLKAFQQRGARFHFGTVVKRVDKQGAGIRATLGNGQCIEADIVLSAIGVRADLHLAETMGLATHRGIVTDRLLQTSAEHVYALGDCAEVDGHLLFYIAPLLACARQLAATLTGDPQPVHYGAMPVTIKTTLFPTLVAPPPRDAVGAWHIEVDSSTGVKALFKDPHQQLLGFALTGDCIGSRDALSSALPPLMTVPETK